jgi:hypothetical protein
MSDYHRLKELLLGTIEEWQKLPGMNLPTYLSKCLLPSSDYQGLLTELKRLGPRQVCQYQVIKLFLKFIRGKFTICSSNQKI